MTKWKYDPATKNGKPVDFDLDVSVIFGAATARRRYDIESVLHVIVGFPSK